MALVFHQALTISVWTIALCAIALTTASRPLPSVTAVLAIALIASVMVMGRWVGRPRPVLARAPARRRDMDTDASDLFRMDDDGGWQVPEPRKDR